MIFVLVLLAGWQLPGPAQAATRDPAAFADIWRPCGWRTSENKIVRTFDRYRADVPGHFLRGGKSNLLCGNKRFGYRHILHRHQAEWEQAAFLVRRNWRDVADFSIATVVRDPDQVTYNPKVKTYCFSRVVYLVNKNNARTVGTNIPRVVVAESTKRIITAFPSNEQCK
ncbi:hypothetical protein [Cryptosporangium phraense]|uniref:Uncharacterized protein n=1 Tax=Cryptosporangium phraense TaxID=2593070 RepID=A0A545ATE3_9ACTN|nr:hypothetical protein [Cryptosporangium phraense]TQS44521.1 hypothetical protein FL583_13755 [Cryptosporangium phraense]